MSVLDSNLPIFHLVPSRISPTTETAISQSQHDSTPSPKYLKRRDPSLTDTYSITLLDAHYPDIIYASLSAPAIYSLTSTPSKPRKSTPSQTSTTPPPPDPPKVPAQLTIGLYNPDSRVILTQKPSSWGSGPYWEFSLPKTSFLQPTRSKLDHELDAAGRLLAVTPVATFRWRKEGGVLTRGSLRCSLIHESNVLDDGGSGPAIPTDPNTNGKRKASGPSEPDITVAIFTNGLMGGKSAGKGEITIFEPNLKRVEVEDLKGLEVTLVMTAMAIADVYFGDMRTGFNLGPRAPAGFSGPGRTVTIVKGQQVDVGIANSGLVVPGSSAPAARRGSAVNGAGSGGGSEISAAPPPYAGGPPPGFTGDTKVRPTQEQLFNPAYQQQLRDEERRKKEAAERAEQEAREAAARRRREMVEQARLAEQEAEARRLQRQFEMEAARERARIEAETRRLREEWERERVELERRQGRRIEGLSGSSRSQSQPGATGRQDQQHLIQPHYQQQQPAHRPPLLTVNGIPPRGGSQAQNTSMSGAKFVPGYPPRPQNGQHLAPQVQSKKFGWFRGGGVKMLDQAKDRRRSFMGLRIFGESHAGSGNTSTPKQKEKEKEKDKGKGKLEKKKSGLW
ncbi:hypothetical protein EV426DRAFT_66607 [Tirmania nivea]|nr:hypothetical protein EV426DRAFT_66607 [Tirmania nivea]